MIHFNSFNMKTAPQEDKLTHDQKRLYNWYINVQIFAQNWWTKREYRAVYGDADAIRIVSTTPLFKIGRNRLSDLSEFSPIWIFAEDVWIILYLGNLWISFGILLNSTGHADICATVYLDILFAGTQTAEICLSPHDQSFVWYGHNTWSWNVNIHIQSNS